VASLLGCVVVAREAFKIFPTEGGRQLDLPLLRRSMGFAARAFLILLFGYLLSRMPVIALGLQGDIHSVGLVSIVIQFLDALLILPSSVAMVLFPQLVSGETRGGAPKTFNATLWVVAIMAAVSGVLALISTPLIVFMFGEAFRDSAEALRWALPGVVLLSAVNVFGQYLAAEGFPISTVFAWAIATAIGYGLVPSEPGPDAAKYAAGALSCAYAVLAVGMAAIFARTLRHSRTEV
jgi:O-antigen/teichoic acid export membrane protein